MEYSAVLVWNGEDRVEHGPWYQTLDAAKAWVEGARAFSDGAVAMVGYNSKMPNGDVIRLLDLGSNIDVVPQDLDQPRYDWRVVAVIDGERQRLATLCLGSDSPPVREEIARRVRWLTQLLDNVTARYIPRRGERR